MSKYEKEAEAEFAQIFKALSNPNRLRIFLKLVSCCPPNTPISIEEGAGANIGDLVRDLNVPPSAGSQKEGDACACVGDLGRDLDIVPSTVSHHIKELYRAGLIRSARRGQKMECWVDPEVLKKMKDFFSL